MSRTVHRLAIDDLLMRRAAALDGAEAETIAGYGRAAWAGVAVGRGCRSTALI